MTVMDSGRQGIASGEQLRPVPLPIDIIEARVATVTHLQEQFDLQNLPERDMQSAAIATHALISTHLRTKAEAEKARQKAIVEEGGTATPFVIPNLAHPRVATSIREMYAKRTPGFSRDSVQLKLIGQERNRMHAVARQFAPKIADMAIMNEVLLTLGADEATNPNTLMALNDTFTGQAKTYASLIQLKQQQEAVRQRAIAEQQARAHGRYAL